MIVGTAGHIDHGKTSLVRALTGVETDRLKEEKARGITIELGFAYWPRPSGTIGFVDVPGHERLVHTMLSGATGIDLFLLVVAADDGPMPQTREHLAIADLLGLTRGIVALTKSDLVTPERLAAAEAEMRAALRGTRLSDVPIIPVSSVDGRGLADLTRTLDAAAWVPTRRRADAGFRLAIDRVFTLAGSGTIVTGTILSGRVAVGDQLLVSPNGRTARVRSLHAQGAAAEAAEAGERCALALAGLAVAEVPRGSVLMEPRLHAPTHRIDAEIRVLAGELKALAQWRPVRLHHAAEEVTARVVPLSADAIAPGSTGFVQIVTDAPIAAAVGDRIVLRDISATRTIAGGTILDIAAPERRRRTPERLAELEATAITDGSEALRAVLEGPRGWVDPEGWFRDRAEGAEAAARATAELGLVVVKTSAGSAAFLPDGWARLSADIGARLDATHAATPDLPGLGQEKLRLSLAPRLPVPVFQAVLQRLAAEGVLAIDRSWLRRPGFAVKLSPEEEAIWSRLALRLGGKERFRPPRVRDLAQEAGLDEALVRRIFRLAARRGDLEELARDHFFLGPTVAEMADIVRDLGGASEGFPVVAFRDRLDNGRKVAIQILEFFDRQGLTMRRGDIRRINPHRRDLYSRPAPGGESSPVGRPDFKSGEGRETVLGGFDSRLLRQPFAGPA